MSPRNCLTDAEMSDFVLGKLPVDALDEITGHVEECTDCQVTLACAAGQSDTVLAELRKLVPIDKFTAEPAYQQAVAKIGGAKNPAAPPADAPPAIPPSVARAPQPGVEGLVFGEYTVLEKIGAGGMGQVYKAEHRRMKRIVALKVLPTEAMKSPDAVKRFQREVQAAARLEHPNIVTAHDAGESDGVHFLVMQYVEGQDLSSLSKQRGPLPVVDVINYISQTARGLAYAHSKGIVHRDIKPGNLLLDKEGVVKILDMGLARFDDGVAPLANIEEGLTHSGQVMGTVDYMAPEQAFDTRTADARADVYSLGCTLYRLLIGKSLFTGESLMQKLLAHRESNIPNLCELRSDVPARLNALFQKLVAKQPRDRYQTMNEVVADLDACRTALFALPAAARGAEDSASSTDNSVLSFPETANLTRKDLTVDYASANPSPAAKAISANQPPNYRRRWLLAAAGGAAAILAGVIIILQHPDGTQTRIEAPDRTKVIVPGVGSITVPVTESLPPASPFDQLKHESIPADDLQFAGNGDPSLVPAEVVAVLRYEMPNSENRLAKTWSNPYTLSAISPDGRLIAFTSSANRCLIRSFGATKFDDWVLKFPAGAKGLVFGPDSKLLVSSHNDGSIKLWSTSSTELEATLTEPSGALAGMVAVSPDGKTLAFASNLREGHDGAVRLWDLKTQTQRAILPGHDGAIVFAFSPDQKTIATALGKGKSKQLLRLWDVATGRESPGPISGKGKVSDVLAFSPDGTHLVAANAGVELRIWEMSTGKERPPLKTPHAGVVAYSADGKTIATAGRKGAVQLWHADSGKERQTIAIGPPDGYINSIAFDPTGRYLVTANGNGTGYVVRVAESGAANQSTPAISSPTAPDLVLTPSPFDILQHSDVPVEALTTAGLGDPAQAPAELVALFNHGDKWATSTDVLAYAPTSGTIASVTNGRHGVRFWNVAARLAERTFNFPEDSAFVLAISPDGQFLATAGPTPTIKIWDLVTRTEKAALNGHTQQVRSLAFSPDGKLLASGSGKDDDGPVRIWDLAANKERHVLKGHTYHVFVAFSPDGKQLVSSSGDSGGGMHLWDVATGRDLGTFPEQFTGSNTVAFSPNGQMIATGGNSGRVVVLDVSTRKTLAVLLRPQRDRINSVAFSADNKLVAVSGVDGAVHLWDIATAAEVRKFQIGPADSSINQVAFDATGRYLLTGNGNASVAVLRLVPVATVSAPTRPDASADPDRRAAEWVLNLSLDAYVTVRLAEAGKKRLPVVRRFQDLPSDKFKLLQVNLGGPKTAKVTDADMENLRGLSDLEFVQIAHMRSGRLTDETFVVLAEIKSLKTIHLGTCKVGDKGISRLAELPLLADFDLGRAKNVTDAGVATLRGLPLVRLQLDGTSITDRTVILAPEAWPQLKIFGLPDAALTAEAGKSLQKLSQLSELSFRNSTTMRDEQLQYLVGLKGLRSLNLGGSAKNITDASIEHLVTLTSLVDLWLQGTSITPAGFARLQKALPNCTIHTKLAPEDELTFDSGSDPASPSRPSTPAADPDRQTAQWVLSLRSQVNSGFKTYLLLDDGNKQPFARNSGDSLPEAPFKIKTVQLNGVRVEDADFTQLAGLTELTGLSLSHLKLSDAAIANVGVLPKLERCTISHAGRITDETLKTLARMPTLRRISIGVAKGISDEGLAHLRPLTELELLGLSGCANLTDAGLAHLTGLKKLQTLALKGTKVTPAGIAALQLALPTCQILWDDPSQPITPDADANSELDLQ